jgi:hypothetical protein
MGDWFPTFRYSVVVSASLGDRCPMVSSPKDKKTCKNDFTDFSTIYNEITKIYRNVGQDSPSNT